MTSLNQLVKIIESAENIHISLCDVSGITNNEIFSLPTEHLIHSMKFCDLAKATSKGFELCMRCKGACNKMSVRKKQPFAGCCSFGQYEIVYPVCAGENVICIIYIGNLVRDMSESVNRLHAAAKKTGGSFDEMSQMLLNMHRTDSNIKYFELAELISEYILYHFDKIKKQPGKQMNWSVKIAVEYAKKDFAMPITLKDIAKACFINEKYLGRIFIKETGQTFREYLTQRRLERAQSLLEHTDEDIIKISLDCGFTSHSYFTNVFKKQFNMTPKEYRSKYSRISLLTHDFDSCSEKNAK